ncbi:MAG TPA: hypothetical protein PK971_15635, partial [Saprospiraceae bacterium]|nr:hypothetical protein [Saprospiraceae bacterium]
MNEGIWQNLVRSAVVGTERSPLPEGMAAAFGLSAPEGAPAPTLLDTMAAAAAARRNSRLHGR